MDLGQLQLAAESAGLPMDWMGRIYQVQQPNVYAAVWTRYFVKVIAQAIKYTEASSLSVMKLSLVPFFQVQAQTLVSDGGPGGTEEDVSIYRGICWGA